MAQQTPRVLAVLQRARTGMLIMPMVLAALLTPTVLVGGAGSPIAEDPTHLGPYAVASQEYRLPAAVDELVLDDRAVEYWAVVWAPTNAPADERLPLTVFLHGNHATCGTGSNPRRDTNSCDRVYCCSRARHLPASSHLSCHRLTVASYCLPVGSIR